MMWKVARSDYDGPVGLQLSLALMSVPSSLLLPAVLGNVKNASTEEEHSPFYLTPKEKKTMKRIVIFLSQRRRDGQYRQKQQCQILSVNITTDRLMVRVSPPSQ